MSTPRTKVLSTKLSDDEYAELERAAGVQTLSMWARDVLLQTARRRSDGSVVIAEVLSLRAILLNLHYYALRGGHGGDRRADAAADRPGGPRPIHAGHGAPGGGADAGGAVRIWGPSDGMAWGFRPPFVPLRVLLAMALVGGLATAAYRYLEVWTPLQRHYLAAYVRSAVALSTRGDYDLWQVVDRQGTRLALDEKLVSVTTATGKTSFALAAPAAPAGAMRLVSARQTYAHAALHAFLRRWIYRDQTVLDLLRPALWSALALFLGGVIGARAQTVVDARRWRGSSPVWPQSAPSVILDHVERLPRAPASVLPVVSPPPHQGFLSSPVPRPSTSTSATTTAGTASRPALPSAPSRSWPDPFFQ